MNSIAISAFLVHFQHLKLDPQNLRPAQLSWNWPMLWA